MEAAVPPPSAVAEKSYRHPAVLPPQRLQPAAEPLSGAALAFEDARSSRLASLVLAEPLVPGFGNALTWETLGGRPASPAASDAVLWKGVLAFLERHLAALGVDAAELTEPRIGVFDRGQLALAHAGRTLDGVPVRAAAVTAVVRHGNLVMLGIENWVVGPGRGQPQVSAAQARAAVSRHVAPFAVEAFAGGERLEYIPLDEDGRLTYRLAWAVRARVRGDGGAWEALVDAASGELLAFEDTNQYVVRKAVGGVYPVSNDQRPPDGIEQPGWPLPWLDVTTPAGTITTTTGGTIGCVSGTVSTALTGRAVRIADSCGAVAETSAAGDLDLGFGPTPTATDCQVPPGHSAGDTKAARSAFYELTRINEQARGYLPANAWLQTALGADVNMSSSCGALWTGSRVRFYRSSATCRNSGEIAAIFDHEWGHGMDANGVNPNISSPGEGVADVHAFLRLNASCIGRGFFTNMVCNGYGDPCLPPVSTGCTGVRDIDFERHACGRPHTLAWATSGFPAGHCVDGIARPACPTGFGGPCGRLGHCEGLVLSETIFDLARRDLPAAGFDANTAHEL
ncbi:MAG TPA: PepSY domain-containing protein, partial [Vicinamibacteria bacterium]|nr:PepSY domain-containing protein [Vicinamibacteria bacterium]